MPRPKKTDGISSVKLISDMVSPDSPTPDLSALGDLAAPITFPEDQKVEEPQKRHRGRPRKQPVPEQDSAYEAANATPAADTESVYEASHATSESAVPSYESAPQFEQAQPFEQAQQFNSAPQFESISAPQENFAESTDSSTQDFSPSEFKAAENTNFYPEENSAPADQNAQTATFEAPQVSVPAENSPDMSSVQNNPSFEAPMPDAPYAGAMQNNRRYPNMQQNNRFNNNDRFNKYNNKYNKFGKNKLGRNRFLPQDDIPEEQLQAPPADPEKVAEAMQHWRELRNTPMFDLQEKATALNIPDVKRLKKQSLIYRLLAVTSGEGNPIYAEGTLEIIKENEREVCGFLRSIDLNYLPSDKNSSEDIYISLNQIRRFDLKSGDSITGLLRQPREGERYFGLARIDTINGEDPIKAKHRVGFEYLTPIHPYQKLNLEWKQDDYSTRIMDLFAPIGKGQRSIILAPPRTGKTVLLQNIASAIAKNHPEVKLFVLLIDERPEEVTDMRRHVKGEVIASTFDEPPEHHTKVATILLEKAKRLVEYGNDVVILLDSITRFARANNVVIPHSGKILSGGVDALAMQFPKRFFGAARKIENGGSLTIIGTALIDTGSRMDEVIFEEFKGTGNMELVLDRRIAEKRIWPAIDIFKSGTRKEELLLSEDTLRRVWILRKFLQEQPSTEIIEFMRDKLSKTMNNEEFLASMNG